MFRGITTKLITIIAIVAAALVAVAPVGAVGKKPARTILAANTVESQVLVEINKLRVSRGLAPLKTSARLRAAADTHSASMGQHGFFAHESRDGSEFWKRVVRFYGKNGYPYWSVGENLLWATEGIEASAALKMWMDSPAHRDNLLASKWREIGLSAVRVPAAPGVFNGLDVVIITADFGVRR